MDAQSISARTAYSNASHLPSPRPSSSASEQLGSPRDSLRRSRASPSSSQQQTRLLSEPLSQTPTLPVRHAQSPYFSTPSHTPAPPAQYSRSPYFSTPSQTSTPPGRNSRSPIFSSPSLPKWPGIGINNSRTASLSTRSPTQALPNARRRPGHPQSTSSKSPSYRFRSSPPLCPSGRATSTTRSLAQRMTPESSPASRVSTPSLPRYPTPAGPKSDVWPDSYQTDLHHDTGKDLDVLNEVIMGIDMKKDGKIGCAYYVVADGTLFIEEDIAMGGIEAAETFVLQIQPTTIIVPNRAPDVLAEFLEQDAQRFDDDAESSSELQGSYILRHLAAAEFDYDAAKESLVRVDLGGPSVPASDHVEVITTDEDGVDCIGSSDHSRLVHLAGSVNINSHIAIGCAGAVLHDIARRRATEQQATDATEVAISFQVKSIKMITPTDTMLVSADALTSLHILRSDLHPNPQIQSSHSSQPRVRESLSVFGLLQALACTVEGKSKLRQMLFRPSTDLDLIRERQRTIAVFLRPENRDAVESIRRQLKKIKNIRTPLFRLKRGVGRIRGQLSIRIGDWKVLLRFAMISTQLREALLSLSGALGVELFSRIYNNIDSKKMLSVGDMIMKTIDFKLSKEKGHTEIMPGSSAKLDEMRQEFADLYHMLPEVTRGIQKGVPPWATEHIRDCIIFPRLGFLTAVAVNPDTGQGMYDGQGSLDDEWNSVFSSGDLIYFKNRAMTDLDHEYGDLPSLIADEELEVMTDLSAIVLEHEDLLVGTSKLLGELDSLLALASAAEKYRWAAPEMTPSNVVDIVGGRHPLQELYVPSFIPNDCSMAGGRGSDGFRGDDDLMSDRDETIKPCMLILTGPNNSGKSVYMRQVAIIVYLAHVGSYVPATRATIGVTDRILTRIATRETVMDDESAFLTDLKQAAFTMNFATRRSLIIADEFGKGTTVETGSAIFTAYLAHFLDLGVERPKVLVGTHFHEVFENDLVEPEDGVGFAHMDVRFNPEAEDPEDQITFLYQLLPGRGASSLGTMCAAINGVEREVVERAEFIVGLLEMNEDLEMVCQEVTEEDVEELLQAEMMARRFLAMDFPSPRRNPEDLVFVREMLEEVISTPDTEDIMSL